MQVDEFVIAYYLKDEPEYARLLHLFGPDAAAEDDLGKDVCPAPLRG